MSSTTSKPIGTFIDLTHTLSTSTIPQTLYPGHPPFELKAVASIPNDGYSVHVLSIGTHGGTHIDAPCHFVEGTRSIDQIPLEELVGRGILLDLSVLQLTRRHKIVWEDFERAWGQRKMYIPSQGSTLKEHLRLLKPRFLLVRTGWPEAARANISAPDFPVQFFGHPYFSDNIGTELLSLDVGVIGLDTPNPDETPFDEEDPATGKVSRVGGPEEFAFHHAYLGGHGLIVENMANLDVLADSQPDKDGTWVNVIPLKLEGSDGSPVRAYAYRDGGSK